MVVLISRLYNYGPIVEVPAGSITLDPKVLTWPKLAETSDYLIAANDSGVYTPLTREIVEMTKNVNKNLYTKLCKFIGVTANEFGAVTDQFLKPEVDELGFANSFQRMVHWFGVHGYYTNSAQNSFVYHFMRKDADPKLLQHVFVNITNEQKTIDEKMFGSGINRVSGVVFFIGLGFIPSISQGLQNQFNEHGQHVVCLSICFFIENENRMFAQRFIPIEEKTENLPIVTITDSMFSLENAPELGNAIFFDANTLKFEVALTIIFQTFHKHPVSEYINQHVKYLKKSM